ncbi:MAG: Hsp70 family protein, partial [Vicinamibacterales bacterium]|nr:Hsp70 family protein [Vicinamibacterales bacterium]
RELVLEVNSQTACRRHGLRDRVQMQGQVANNTQVKQALADAGLQAAAVDEVVLVGGSTRMPKVQSLVRDYFGKDPHKGVNPDEVVAIGAAIQGGVLAGDVKDVLLLDVTPLSLGIETLGGVMTPLIPRNTTIPTRKSEIFSTAADSQTSVEVHVLQGERPGAKDNRTLGRFHLVGLAPAPRGVPQVEVIFNIDANGIVHVSATDKATAKAQEMTITASSGLSSDDVDRLVQEAAAHEAEDRAYRTLIDERNQLDAAVYGLEHTVTENRDRLPQPDVERAETSMAAAREASKGTEVGVIQAAAKDLQQRVEEIAGLLPRPEEPPASQGDPTAPDGEVIDGEVVGA